MSACCVCRGPIEASEAIHAEIVCDRCWRHVERNWPCLSEVILDAIVDGNLVKATQYVVEGHLFRVVSR